MEIYQQKTPINLYLVIVTLFFVVAGLAFSYSTVKNGLEQRYCWSNNKLYVAGSQVVTNDGSICTCSGGKLACREIPKADKAEFTIKDFTNKNLSFSTKYLSPNIPEAISKNILQVSFEDVSVKNGNFQVVLHQVQNCTQTLKVPAQVGSYNFTNNTLTLLNAINNISTIYNKPCLVELIYTLNKFKINDDGTFKLRFSNDKFETINGNICLYNSKVYSEGDKYVASDKCNVCSCSDGVSKCSTNISCPTK
ncbi:MAG TPA: hypothetical protein VHA74_01510 [Candidatus Dojkabacteria bacterium]|nr:hypothetical protein [Candidatus Dojkabacteria bacterium]